MLSAASSGLQKVMKEGDSEGISVGLIVSDRLFPHTRGLRRWATVNLETVDASINVARLVRRRRHEECLSL